MALALNRRPFLIRIILNNDHERFLAQSLNDGCSCACRWCVCRCLRWSCWAAATLRLASTQRCSRLLPLLPQQVLRPHVAMQPQMATLRPPWYWTFQAYRCEPHARLPAYPACLIPFVASCDRGCDKGGGSGGRGSEQLAYKHAVSTMHLLLWWRAALANPL
jgi:hypothetical protein